MEGIHERFLVSVKSGSSDREFEVVPSIGHYAILENDETVAEISIDDNGTHISDTNLPKGVVAALIEKIQEHGA